ncbi:MAG: ribonucleoside-triphosphate reductase [Candidatus Aminicenantes bacterium]|nr:ribonucleoside-triphosphate reductase [Candidatus Aminicenantes bacterium]
MEEKIKKVKKRDGRIVPFNRQKIINAISKAMRSVKEGNLEKDPVRVAEKGVKELEKRYFPNYIPGIEEIQDVVEEKLILMDFPKTTKAYILYRQERAKIREKQKAVPKRVKELAKKSKEYFPDALGEFIYYRTYSRWLPEEQRRETWIETVDRYIKYMHENLGDKITNEKYKEIREYILNLKAMPSMRLIWSAGEAARATHVATYNCSYLAPNKLKDFAEIMYLLMCGAGVGFSVENQNIQQLPIIKYQTGEKLPVHVIRDSKEGWGDALVLGMKTWYEGKEIQFDYSKIRPYGARLETMGGISSGPEPLRSLLDFTRKNILRNQGMRLSSIDVHDIICKIGQLVEMGGVRRSALISLSDLEDDKIRDSKSGHYYIMNPQRSMANNSAVYNSQPSATIFMEEWLSLAKSGTGERGIFNREGLEKQMPQRRWEKFKEHLQTSGTNPCGEITLRDRQFCNLTEIVARAEDTEETLLKKAEIAAILGTYQSSLTEFPYISKEWKKNCDEERLLGVSITGQWDCPAVRQAEVLKKIYKKIIDTNKKYAKKFNINPSTSVTSVKPSGTVSQLVNAAPGMHPRHSPYYVRRIRISTGDPLCKMLREQKVPYHPEVGQTEASATTYVFDFPVKSPSKSTFKKDLNAIDQLEYWKMVKENYTEHNPSQTILTKDDEWIKVANWLYENWDIIGGLTFLPRDNTVYQLAPFEEISEEEYEKLLSEFPEIDFSQILIYEKEKEIEGRSY